MKFKACCMVSLLLFLVFIIKTIADYTRYSESLNSAPFYLWILVNAIYFIMPAIIVFLVGMIFKKKKEK